MMHFLKIAAFVFILFAWTRALLRFREKKINVKQLLLWTLIWAGIGIAVFFQKLTFMASEFLGISRGSDLVVYVSVVLLLYMVFRIYVKMEKIEQDITRIIRKLALEKIDEGKGKKK
ncbi:MAG: DUF2304 family protein [Candidatus Woesearchaeota archaeon]|nr:DUF2304 family protein [Candidatus Woesearchaeota archaeon]